MLPGDLQLSFGYRWQRSDRTFIGDEEQLDVKEDGEENINDIHLLDFAVSYGLTERLSATFSMPVLLGYRSEPILDAGGDLIGRNDTAGTGIGDMSLTGLFWLLDPSDHPGGNVALGLGAKFPTGEDDVVDTIRLASGAFATRTVDQSIQPGDGGFGFVAEIRAFQTVADACSLYLHGLYLFNPRDTNGVPTFRSSPSESVMSVSDQFLGRAGVSWPVPWEPLRGLIVSLGLRVEGVPVHDAIGDSNGFRRPGIAISAEPGVTYAWGPAAFSLSVPVAFYRNRWQSVPEMEDGREGDAAFADFMVLFGMSYRFGGGAEACEVEPPVPSVLGGS